MLHTFKIIPRMSLVPDSRSVPRRQPVLVSLRLTLDPTHPVTRLYQTQGRTSIKGKQKTGVHTPVRIKFSPSVGVPPTGVPRRCCNAGYSAQHHGQDQYNHSHKNTSREIMFSFQNKKVLLLRSMLVRTPAIRPNAAAEIHLFSASIANRMGTWQGNHII